MLPLRTFLQSPLARHPWLLARKIGSRLELTRGRVSVPPPPRCASSYPAHWAPALRGWLQGIPLSPGPHPFQRVFGQDFDETLLLRLCREGPRRDDRGLPGDIKLIWDYSRAQPLFTNAAVHPAHLDAGDAFVRRWLEANADTNGPAWTCAMDVAIRAVNWIFADVLFGGELGRRLDAVEWAGWLWRHGYLIWRGLEARMICSNHYLADLLGLLVIGAVFADDPSARRWFHFARKEFPGALLAQTRRDGGLGEASLRYHALVTEMALLGRLALGAAFSAPAESRLRAMCRIVSDFRDATGDVFPIGDDDSGRILAVDFASPWGRAEILLKLAESLLQEAFRPSAAAVYPESGWWIRRAGEFVVALDFGGVGLRGLGAHAHNDDFSVCLEWRDQPVIVDPGTFLYTPDPEARNRFRSTASHNTLMIDGAEQRGLGREPFLLRGSDNAFPAHSLDGDTWAFSRNAAPGVVHRRELSVRDTDVSIRDFLEGRGPRTVEWRFQLHPAVQPSPEPRGFALEVPGAGALLLEAAGFTPTMDICAAEYSRGYGHVQPTKVCVARGQFSLPLSGRWIIRPVE